MQALGGIHRGGRSAEMHGTPGPEDGMPWTD
jgi:hypothetical protein